MKSPDISRRNFLIASSTAATALMTNNVFAHSSVEDSIKVGLIGCGGRGTGAAIDCANANPNVVITALGDLFRARVDGSAGTIKENIGARFQVKSDQMFDGFDAFKQVCATDVDLVILATPPGFRPGHLAAAIAAGKHVFMEKPVATDAPGVRSVLASSEEALKKGLAIVAGTQRRHELPYLEVMKRIHEGAIGEVISASCYWNQGYLWHVPRSEVSSDMEWQIKNWLYFTWLSGDHICEQHIHNIDVCNWAFQDAHPVECIGLGGREVRKAADFGHIFDHHAVEYTYASGAKMHSYCRQIDGTVANVSERIVGTKGTSNPASRIDGENPYRYDGEKPNPYVLEHRDLINSILEGKPLNEGKRIAESTLTAIMGRMSTYTGQKVTWEQAMNSQESLLPAELAFGPCPTPEIAVPGKTKLV